MADVDGVILANKLAVFCIKEDAEATSCEPPTDIIAATNEVESDKNDNDGLGRKRLDSTARPNEFAGQQPGRGMNRMRVPSMGVLGPGQGLPFEETQRVELEKMCDNAHRLATVYNDTAGAIQAYKDVLRQDDGHVRALANLGALYHREGDFQNARTLYLRALQIRPDRSKTTYNLGRLEHECGEHDAARNMYETALLLECDDSTTCNALAYLGLLQQEIFGDLEKAQNCYAHSLAICPNHVRTLDHNCALLVLRDQFNEARELHRLVCRIEAAHTYARPPAPRTPFHCKPASPRLLALLPRLSSVAPQRTVHAVRRCGIRPPRCARNRPGKSPGRRLASAREPERTPVQQPQLARAARRAPPRPPRRARRAPPR
jgi:Tfp pilus assembly protein PilF